jgi:hypothetical protein
MLISDELADVVGVVSCIGDHKVGGLALEQCCRLWRVTPVAGGEYKVDRAAKPSHRQMNFGAQAAARTSDCLILSPPFAPLACW